MLTLRYVLCALLFATPPLATAEPAQTAVDMEQLGWLEGRWVGEGLGATAEEIWSSPADGTMMGVFRLIQADGSVSFYELLLIDATGLKLKHFNADLTAWETKDEMLHFKFAAQTPTSLTLNGLKFESPTPDTLIIELTMQGADGSRRIETFDMQRQPLP